MNASRNNRWQVLQFLDKHVQGAVQVYASGMFTQLQLAD
jgi:hypothetical protein